MFMFLAWSLFLMLLSSLMFLLTIFLFSLKSSLCGDVILFENKIFEVKLDILADWLGFMFVFIVLLISSMILMYSQWYMGWGFFQSRFLMVLLLFICSMCLLIVMPSIFSMILGWDGLGFVSFILVAFYCNFKSYYSSMITILFNRLGDLVLLVSMLLSMVGGVSLLLMVGALEMKLVGILLMLTGFSKSAQVPLSAWLPAAMAAPTPVSSLVHSSTLVTAGVYIMLRMKNFLSMESSLILGFISLFTLLGGSLSAVYETDFKKVIAMSTLSQLGLMLFFLSQTNWELCYMHMLLHALFKASLFMCAGAIIAYILSQDCRVYGSVLIFSPIIAIIFNICNFSLMSFPLLGGFFSKELFCSEFLANSKNYIFMLIFFFSVLLTVIYSLRLSKNIFWQSSSKNVYMASLKEKSMEIPLGLMSMMVIFFSNFINLSMEEWMLFSVISKEENTVLLSLVIFSILLYWGTPFKKLILLSNSKFFSSMGFLYFLSGNSLVQSLLISSKYKSNELSPMEIIGGMGTYSSLSKMGMEAKMIFSAEKILMTIAILTIFFVL